MGRGRLFILSAPSGAGKSTLIDRIRPKIPDMLYSVSCTTRPPREGEEDGVHYHFLDEDQFRGLIEEGKLLEWKEVHGNMYGTPSEPVNAALDSGRRMILDIDVEGAKEVFKRVPDAVGIFVSAPDLNVLDRRLRSRGTDSEESLNTRMANAAEEMRWAELFGHHIVNDDLDTAVERLAAIIREESAEKG